MDYFLLVCLIGALFIWFRYKTAKSTVANQTRTVRPKTPSATTFSGRFSFQEAGTDPRTDSEGRVVVKVKGGSNGLAFGINKLHLEPELAGKLAGKVSEDEEFAKSIRARVRPDKKSEYSNSFIVETTAGNLIGWILKSDSEEAASVFGQLDSAVRRSAPELGDKELTFEVSLRIEGYWNEEDYEDEGGLVWEPDFELMEIRIKVPVEVEVE